jgi:membrane fusion protein (multidrug efflux system)
MANASCVGMFASVEIATGKPQRLITLPQTAIVYAPFGNSVFLAQARAPIRKAPQGSGSSRTKPSFGSARRGGEVSVLEGCPKARRS